MPAQIKTVSADVISTGLSLHRRAAEPFAIWASRARLLAGSRLRTEAVTAALGARQLIATPDPEDHSALHVLAGFEAFRLCSILKSRNVSRRVTVIVHQDVETEFVVEMIAREITALSVEAAGGTEIDWVRSALRAVGRKASEPLTGEVKLTNARLNRLIGRRSQTRESDPFSAFGPSKSSTLFEAILRCAEDFDQKNRDPGQPRFDKIKVSDP